MNNWDDINYEEFLREFMDIFVRNGYGALPKRETELTILELLLRYKNDWNEKTPAYELARTLRLSPKRLQNMLDDISYRGGPRK